MKIFKFHYGGGKDKLFSINFIIHFFKDLIVLLLNYKSQFQRKKKVCIQLCTTTL